MYNIISINIYILYAYTCKLKIMKTMCVPLLCGKSCIWAHDVQLHITIFVISSF